MNILVVEDEPKAGNYLLNGLQELGYSVSLARDGVDGLHQALETPFVEMPSTSAVSGSSTASAASKRGLVSLGNGSLNPLINFRRKSSISFPVFRAC